MLSFVNVSRLSRKRTFSVSGQIHERKPVAPGAMETRQRQRKAERGWWEAPEGGAEDTGAGCAAQGCKSGTSTVQCGGEETLVVVAGGRGRVFLLRMGQAAPGVLLALEKEP